MAQSTQLLASDTIDLREPVAGSSRFVTTTPEPGAQMAEHHHMSRWVQPVLMILAVWLATSPPIFGYESLALTISDLRSEERSVGKECVSTCRSRCSPYH